jgi:hypothetical protein
MMSARPIVAMWVDNQSISFMTLGTPSPAQKEQRSPMGNQLISPLVSNRSYGIGETG